MSYKRESMLSIIPGFGTGSIFCVFWKSGMAQRSIVSGKKAYFEACSDFFPNVSG